MKKYRDAEQLQFQVQLLLLLAEIFHQVFLAHCLQVSLGKLQNSLYKYKKI